MEQCPDPSTCIEAPVILDLGCGNGYPFLKEFADCGYHTVGVDSSKEMIDMSSTNVPAAKLYNKSMDKCNFKVRTFDVVVANHSIQHLPRREHIDMFRKIREWLKGGGRFLYSGLDGTEKEWVDANVYKSHYDFDKTVALMEEAGFEFDYAEQDDGGWIQARA